MPNCHKMVECSRCDRLVRKDNLTNHYRGPFCRKEIALTNVCPIPNCHVSSGLKNIKRHIKRWHQFQANKPLRHLRCILFVVCRAVRPIILYSRVDQKSQNDKAHINLGTTVEASGGQDNEKTTKKKQDTHRTDGERQAKSQKKELGEDKSLSLCWFESDFRRTSMWDRPGVLWLLTEQLWSR